MVALRKPASQPTARRSANSRLRGTATTTTAITTTTAPADAIELPDLLSAGLYWPDDVRRLAGVPVALSRRFIRDYKGRRGLWGGGQQRAGRYYYATFRDLIELRYVNAMHVSGVSWQRICLAAEYAGTRFKTDYPFSDRRFQTDGSAVFDLTDAELEAEIFGHDYEYDLILDDLGPEQGSEEDQSAFSEIIAPYLYEPLDYMDDIPTRWYPAEEWGLNSVGRSVLVDPLRSFGAPVIQEHYIPTDTLYRNYVGEGCSVRQVALSYDILDEAVWQAVAFEEKLARRAAGYTK